MQLSRSCYVSIFWLLMKMFFSINFCTIIKIININVVKNHYLELLNLRPVSHSTKNIVQPLMNPLNQWPFYLSKIGIFSVINQHKHSAERILNSFYSRVKNIMWFCVCRENLSTSFPYHFPDFTSFTFSVVYCSLVNEVASFYSSKKIVLNSFKITFNQDNFNVIVIVCLRLWRKKGKSEGKCWLLVRCKYLRVKINTRNNLESDATLST